MSTLSIIPKPIEIEGYLRFLVSSDFSSTNTGPLATHELRSLFDSFIVYQTSILSHDKIHRDAIVELMLYVDQHTMTDFNDFERWIAFPTSTLDNKAADVLQNFRNAENIIHEQKNIKVFRIMVFCMAATFAVLRTGTPRTGTVKMITNATLRAFLCDVLTNEFDTIGLADVQPNEFSELTHVANLVFFLIDTNVIKSGNKVSLITKVVNQLVTRQPMISGGTCRRRFYRYQVLLSAILCLRFPEYTPCTTRNHANPAKPREQPRALQPNKKRKRKPAVTNQTRKPYMAMIRVYADTSEAFHQFYGTQYGPFLEPVSRPLSIDTNVPDDFPNGQSQQSPGKRSRSGGQSKSDKAKRRSTSQDRIDDRESQLLRKFGQLEHDYSEYLSSSSSSSSSSSCDCMYADEKYLDDHETQYVTEMLGGITSEKDGEVADISAPSANSEMFEMENKYWVNEDWGAAGAHITAGTIGAPRKNTFHLDN